MSCSDFKYYECMQTFFFHPRFFFFFFLLYYFSIALYLKFPPPTHAMGPCTLATLLFCSSTQFHEN
jgi:hypothetical protein